MHQECRSFIWVLLLSICVSAGYAEDTYNGSELAIPTVIIGAGT
jgi:hypothetical protein